MQKDYGRAFAQDTIHDFGVAALDALCCKGLHEAIELRRDNFTL